VALVSDPLIAYLRQSKSSRADLTARCARPLAVDGALPRAPSRQRFEPWDAFLLTAKAERK
jgi:hypothetical protein